MILVFFAVLGLLRHSEVFQRFLSDSERLLKNLKCFNYILGVLRHSHRLLTALQVSWRFWGVFWHCCGILVFSDDFWEVVFGCEHFWKDTEVFESFFDVRFFWGFLMCYHWFSVVNCLWTTEEFSDLLLTLRSPQILCGVSWVLSGSERFVKVLNRSLRFLEF